MDSPPSIIGEVRANDLADWIERQGEDLWWAVDGDPRLMGVLSFPCPGDELAAEFRRINESLLVLGYGTEHANGRKELERDDLDRLVDKSEDGGRVLPLMWRGDKIEWLLMEDPQTTESVKREMNAEVATPAKR